MRKLLIALFVVFLCAVIGFILANDLAGENVGSYIHGLNIIICHNTPQCLHEEGHALDEKLGYPSQAKRFQNLADFYYPTLGLERDYMEFYAQKYSQWKMGWIELPEELLPFFSEPR